MIRDADVLGFSLGWDRWVLMTMIGILIGLLAWLLKQCLLGLDSIKWARTREYAKVTVGRAEGGGGGGSTPYAEFSGRRVGA